MLQVHAIEDQQTTSASSLDPRARSDVHQINSRVGVAKLKHENGQVGARRIVDDPTLDKRLPAGGHSKESLNVVQRHELAVWMPSRFKVNVQKQFVKELPSFGEIPSTSPPQNS